MPADDRCLFSVGETQNKVIHIIRLFSFSISPTPVGVSTHNFNPDIASFLLY